MVESNDSFIREVNEEFRREQLKQLWSSYGSYIIAGLAVLLVGVGYYQWSESSRIAAEEAAGARFEAASQLIAANKEDEAKAAFAKVAAEGTTGYRALASLHVASAHVKGGQVAEALKIYEALGKQGDVDELLRDFATLQAAMLRLDQADWTEMKNRLTPLVDDARPWHAQAREVLGLAAYKAGQTEEATKLFEQILGDRVTSNGLSRRAQEMLALLADAAAAKGSAPAKAEAGKDDASKAPAKAPQPAGGK